MTIHSGQDDQSLRRMQGRGADAFGRETSLAVAAHEGETLRPRYICAYIRPADCSMAAMVPPLPERLSSKELIAKAQRDRRRSADWLKPFMANGQPKFCTKEEFRAQVMLNFDISRTSFDAAWFLVIEETPRQDRHEPLPGRRSPH